MVGTPENSVTFSLSMRPRQRPGSNRGASTMVAALRNAASICTTCPNTWNSGSATSTTSSGRTSPSSTQISAFISRLEWVSIAPLGRPVVPEV